MDFGGTKCTDVELSQEAIKLIVLGIFFDRCLTSTILQSPGSTDTSVRSS